MSRFLRKGLIRCIFVVILVITLFLLILFSSENALATITVTNVTNMSGDAAFFSLSHTIPSSSNRLLVFTIGYSEFQTVRNVTSVTYGGQDLTYFGESINESTGNPGVLGWYLVNPPEGTQKTNVTLATHTAVAFGIISYSGVNQSNPISSLSISFGQDQYPYVLVSSENGDLVQDVMSSLTVGGLPYPGTGQIERWNLETSGGHATGSTENGSSSVNMSWVLPEGGTPWAILGFNINAITEVNNPPNIIINSPQNNSNFSVNYALLNLTASDPEGSNTTAWFFGNDALINTTENVLNNSIVTFNWSSLLDGLYFWNAIISDGANNVSSKNYFFTVDTIGPLWSSMTENYPFNYESSLSIFNITWTDLNLQTVYIESNFSGISENYSMTNLGNGNYEYSVILGVGTYYWKSYANDSLGHSNVSDFWIFTINKATTILDVASSLSWTETYGTQTNITGSDCPSQLTCNLYRNGTEVSNSDIQTLAGGVYNYTYNTSGNENYTSDSKTSLLTLTPLVQTLGSI